MVAPVTPPSRPFSLAVLLSIIAGCATVGSIALALFGTGHISELAFGLLIFGSPFSTLWLIATSIGVWKVTKEKAQGKAVMLSGIFYVTNLVTILSIIFFVFMLFYPTPINT